MNYQIKTNEQYQSKEIYFNEKPNKEIITAMKEKRMRWNPKKTCWYGFINDEDIQEIFNDKALVIPDSSFVDGGGYYDGWAGGKSRTWHSDKELKQFLLEDFKKAGIKATVKFNKAGYLTSITVTMKITNEDLKTFEEWAQGDFYIHPSKHYMYKDENGDKISIYGNDYYLLDESEKATLIDNIKLCMYEYEVKRIVEYSYHKKVEIFTNEANKRFQLLQDIVSSYNRDCSNSQLDYFDRDIYDSYRFKLV